MFIERNQLGAISGAWTVRQQPGQEEVDESAPEFVAFLNPPPSKEKRIAQVLATTGRGKDRTLIQQVISFAEMVAAPMLATQYAVSLELAIMGIYARNKTYRECKDAETAIEAIEDEVP